MKRACRRWSEPQLCGGCGVTIQHWQRFCDGCWGLLPGWLRGKIMKAKEDKASHLVAAAAIEAKGWLKKNSPAAVAARRLGERDAAE